MAPTLREIGQRALIRMHAERLLADKAKEPCWKGKNEPDCSCFPCSARRYVARVAREDV